DGDARRVESHARYVPATPPAAPAPFANQSLNGTVIGNAGAGGASGSVIVYGNLVYQLAAGSNIDVTTGRTDLATFMNGPGAAFQSTIAPASASGKSGTLKLSGVDPKSVNVRPAVELDSSGDLTLTSNWDLTANDWIVNGQPGLLTIRSGGTLDIRATLGLPNPTSSGVVG